MAQVLQEYLVSLGYKVDQNQYARFRDALKTTASETAKLGIEVAGVGAALTAMVDTVARHFENLYYVSQRTGASVASLDAISFAAKQIGVSTEAAIGNIEGLAHAIRTQPGVAQLLRAWGLNPNDPHGAMLGIVDHLKKQFGERGYSAAQAQATGLFGLDEQTFNSLWHFGNQLKTQEQDHIKRMSEAGMNADEVAGKFTDFGRVMNHLGDQFSIAGTRIAVDWLPEVTKGVTALDSLVGAFSRADDASGGLLGKITGLVISIGGVEAAIALLARWFPALAPVAVAPAAAVGGGAYGAWNVIKNLEAKNNTGLPPDWETAAKVTNPAQYLAMGLGYATGMFDPNQFLPGKGKGGGFDIPLPRSRPYTGKPFSSAAEHALAVGMFNDVASGPTDNSRTSTFNVNQNNSYVASSLADAQQFAGFTNQSNAGLATALRNLAQKLQ